VPTLAEFSEKRFAPWAESSCSLKTWRDFYRVGLLAIEDYAPLANLPLDAITTEQVAHFASYRQTLGMKVTTVNASLRILRRVLRVAEEWGELAKVPKIKLLPGEQHRERVITPEEEARYLAAANSLLADVATVLADTGLRPEECHRLRWDYITWINGRNGTLFIACGKTKAARRVLPMTPRVRALLQSRWEDAGRPQEGWIWPAPTESGHIEPSSLKKQHAKALRLSRVQPFVLYSFRHTFATRIAPHTDAWTLCKIMGWASLSVAMRYIHPSGDAVLTAMARLGGHNSGHTAELPPHGADTQTAISD
jgi:integrase